MCGTAVVDGHPSFTSLVGGQGLWNTGVATTATSHLSSLGLKRAFGTGPYSVTFTAPIGVSIAPNDDGGFEFEFPSFGSFPITALLADSAAATYAVRIDGQWRPQWGPSTA